MGSLAAAPTIAPSQGGHPSIYRPRNPRESVLYQLMEAHYDDVKATWEDRFEKRYRFWRGFVDSVVVRYLDCGVAESGFAKLRCEASAGVAGQAPDLADVCLIFPLRRVSYKNRGGNSPVPNHS